MTKSNDESRMTKRKRAGSLRLVKCVHGHDSTHTTLRTLFVATAVFALLAAMWTASGSALAIPLTACGACFVAGLLGSPMFVAFLAGLPSSVVAEAYRIATIPEYRPFTRIIRTGYSKCDRRSLILILLFGVSWLTAWWWGIYLRYAWSRPKPYALSDANPEESQQSPIATRCASGCLIDARMRRWRFSCSRSSQTYLFS